MKPLTRKALARLPLTEAEMDELYALASPGSLILPDIFRIVCESHERLRMELQGAEVLLAEDKK